MIVKEMTCKYESIFCKTFIFIVSAGVLAGGTTSGNIAMWKYAPALGSAGLRQEPEEKWKLQPPTQVNGSVAQLAVKAYSFFFELIFS